MSDQRVRLLHMPRQCGAGGDVLAGCLGDVLLLVMCLLAYDPEQNKSPRVQERVYDG